LIIKQSDQKNTSLSYLPSVGSRQMYTVSNCYWIILLGLFTFRRLSSGVER